MQPTNMDEYNQRFKDNMKIEGFGLDVTQVFPCPFCAAPDWMTTKIIEVEQEMQKEHTCSECGRSAKSIVVRDDSGIRFNIVQTGGDDQPDWFEPKMQRIANESH